MKLIKNNDKITKFLKTDQQRSIIKTTTKIGEKIIIKYSKAFWGIPFFLFH